MEHMTYGGKEYRNVACRDRIPQSSLQRREYLNQIVDIVAFERPYTAIMKIPPFYLKAMIKQAQER